MKGAPPRTSSRRPKSWKESWKTRTSGASSSTPSTTKAGVSSSQGRQVCARRGRRVRPSGLPAGGTPVAGVPSVSTREGSATTEDVVHLLGRLGTGFLHARLARQDRLEHGGDG